jgi:hypothetical protein
MQRVGAPITADGEEVEVVVVSRANDQFMDLYALHVLPLGTTGFTQRGTQNLHLVNVAEFKPWLPTTTGPKPLDPKSIYSMLSKPFARQILSGHILVTNFWQLMAAREALEGTEFSTEFDAGMSLQYANKKDGRVTAITARVYAELTNWCEPFPAKLIADIEGVSVVTIRNRLQNARTQGILASPGSGKRGS